MSSLLCAMVSAPAAEASEIQLVDQLAVASLKYSTITSDVTQESCTFLCLCNVMK